MTDRNGVTHVIFTIASWVWVAVVVRLAVICLWAPVTDKKKNRQMRNTEWHIKTALHFGLLFRSSVLQDLHQHNSGQSLAYIMVRMVKAFFTLCRRLVLNWLMLIPKDQKGFNLFLPAHTHTHTHLLCELYSGSTGECPGCPLLHICRDLFLILITHKIQGESHGGEIKLL